MSTTRNMKPSANNASCATVAGRRPASDYRQGAREAPQRNLTRRPHGQTNKSRNNAEMLPSTFYLPSRVTDTR